MKKLMFILSILCFIFIGNIDAQVGLDVVGDAKIGGNLELEGDFQVNTVKANYLFPMAGTGDPYRFIRFGEPNEFYAGFMWNNNDASFGDGDDFTIFTYENRDIVLDPHGSGKTFITSSLFIGDEGIADAGNDELLVTATFRPGVDHANDLGISNRRWRNLYAKNGYFDDIVSIGELSTASNQNLFVLGRSRFVGENADAIYSTCTSSNGNDAAIRGENTNGIGVVGESNSRFGVHGLSNTGIGVLASSLGNNPTTASNIGVLGEVSGGNGWAGYFNAGVYAAGGFSSPSDAKLKRKKVQIKDAGKLIQQLRPMEYEYKPEEFKSLNLPKGKQYGLIAQELEQVVPELVKETRIPTFESAESENGSKYQGKQTGILEFKTINYVGLIPLLIANAQEQQAIIDTQKEELISVRQEVAELKSLVQQLINHGNTLSVPNTDSNTTTTILNQPALLHQNQPNPFNATTTIQYDLPQATDSALLQITDQKGQVIKTIPLTEKGKGQVELKSGTLAAGTYFYSLLIDGQVQDTKQMVLTK